MGIRKNYRNMTPLEVTSFNKALNDLKAKGTIDYYALMHGGLFGLHVQPGGGPHTHPGIHRSAHFLPWHRELLRRFEQELQQSDPSVTIPYWDSSVYQDPADLLWQLPLPVLEVLTPMLRLIQLVPPEHP